MVLSELGIDCVMKCDSGIGDSSLKIDHGESRRASRGAKCTGQGQNPLVSFYNNYN